MASPVLSGDNVSSFIHHLGLAPSTYIHAFLFVLPALLAFALLLILHASNGPCVLIFPLILISDRMPFVPVSRKGCSRPSPRRSLARVRRIWHFSLVSPLHRHDLREIRSSGVELGSQFGVCRIEFRAQHCRCSPPVCRQLHHNGHVTQAALRNTALAFMRAVVSFLFWLGLVPAAPPSPV